MAKLRFTVREVGCAGAWNVVDQDGLPLVPNCASGKQDATYAAAVANAVAAKVRTEIAVKLQAVVL
jgi:predicted regulator of Ras-like GTPase activity (Roadblock/LC7/MglB family)